MPDFGLGEALLKGIKASKAVRPVEEAVQQAAPRTAEVVTAIVEPARINPLALRNEELSVLTPSSPAPAISSPKPEPIKLLMPEAKVDPEARRISAVNLGQYDLDEIHQTNFNTITTTDDIKAVIADAAERNKGKIDVARRGVITNEQLGLLASELNTSEDVVKQVLERQTGQTLSPEVILASRQVLNASADQLKNLAKKITTGQATDMDRLTFRRQMQFHDEYQTAFMGARAETGRALNAFGIPVGLENNPRQLAALKQTVEVMNGRDTDELAMMVSEIDTVEGLSKFTEGYTRNKIAGTIQELFINSILSGLRTQEVNTIGNVLFQSMNIAETAVAAQMGKMLPGSSHVLPGEATAVMYGAITGWRDGLRLAWKSFKAGQSLDSVSKYEGSTRRAISARNYQITDPTLGAAIDALGTFIRLPTERGMAPTDEFFKAIAYRSDLARMAYRNAMEQANLQPMTPAEVSKLITEFMDNPPPSAAQKSEDYAHYVTFQTPLGQVGADLSKAIEGTPGLFLIAPFIKTPVNIFKAGLLERSPLAVFSRQFREAMATGGPQRDLAVARVAMGTLTVASIAAAVYSGSVTGGGPPNPEARKILEATGWQPYSFRIEDSAGNATYQSYARAEPLAYVIGATADAAEITQAIGSDGDDLKSEQEQANNMIAAIVGGVANNTMSKTFLSGVADFTQALDDPKRYMTGYLQGFGEAMIPYSSFRRQAGQLQDPLLREAWTFSDRLALSSGIPGWSKDLPPKRDIFGEPMTRPVGSIQGAMSAFPDSEETIDPILNEVVRLMQETGTVPIAKPGKRIEGLKLTADEYDELVRISRTEPILGGKTFKEALSDLYASTAYLTATPDFQVVLVRGLQQDVDQIARARLEQDNPEFAAKLASYRYRKKSTMYGSEPLLNPAQ